MNGRVAKKIRQETRRELRKNIKVFQALSLVRRIQWSWRIIFKR